MRKFLLFLGVLLLTLGLSAGVVNATLWTVMDADHTYIDYQDEAGNSIIKIDDDDGVTVTGGFSAGGDFTVTDPTSGDNAVYGLINAGEAWTASDNVVGLRGKAVVTAAGSTGSATGVWAGLEITSASVQRFGLQVGLNVEAYSNTICLPNAVLYIQSLPSGSTTDFSNVPYLVFSETVTNGAGSHILFEVGHIWANTIPDIGEDELFYNDTLQIAVNEQAGTRTAFFIPLSTDSGTFTFEYPTILSNTLTVGAAGVSYNVVFYSDTSGTHLTWDADTEKRLEFTNARFIMGTSSIGIPVTSTNSYAMEVHTEPGSALTAYTSTFGIRSRYHVDAAQTNIVTIEAVDARLRVKQNIAGGVHCGVQGYIEASGTPAFAGGLNAAGSFTLELQSGTTITGATYMCGVSIDSASHTDLVVTDTTYVALRISAGDGPPVKEDWEYGIIMDDGDVGVGIQIGDCTTAFDVEGDTTTAGILFSGAATVDHISITGLWGVGLTSAAISIGDYSNAVALNAGSATTDHTLGIVVNLSADLGASDNVIPLLVKFTTTGDADASAICQNIYSSVNIEHELSDAYGIRTKVAISPSSGETLNLMLPLYAQLVVDDGAITISSEMSCGLFDVDVSAVVTTGNVTGININMNGVAVDNSSTVFGLYVGLEAGCYVDYGIRVALAPNVGITAAQEFYITQGAGSCTVAKGIRFETYTEASQAFTYGIAFDGTVNYIFEFEDGDGTGGADTASGDAAYCATSTAASDGAIRIWVSGEAFFIPIFDVGNTGNSW